MLTLISSPWRQTTRSTLFYSSIYKMWCFASHFPLQNFRAWQQSSFIMSYVARLLLAFQCSLMIGISQGHGYLADPPARSSAWLSDPAFKSCCQYFNHNEMFCGGTYHQWSVMGKVHTNDASLLTWPSVVFVQMANVRSVERRTMPNRNCSAEEIRCIWERSFELISKDPSFLSLSL